MRGCRFHFLTVKSLMRNRDKETGNYKSMWPGQDGSFENSQAGWGGEHAGIRILSQQKVS